jgi:hypothetical protein
MADGSLELAVIYDEAKAVLDQLAEGTIDRDILLGINCCAVCAAPDSISTTSAACPDCRRVYYCSQACREKDSEVHSGPLCEILRLLSPESALAGDERSSEVVRRFLGAVKEKQEAKAKTAREAKEAKEAGGVSGAGGGGGGGGSSFADMMAGLPVQSWEEFFFSRPKIPKTLSSASSSSSSSSSLSSSSSSSSSSSPALSAAAAEAAMWSSALTSDAVSATALLSYPLSLSWSLSAFPSLSDVVATLSMSLAPSNDGRSGGDGGGGSSGAVKSDSLKDVLKMSGRKRTAPGETKGKEKMKTEKTEKKKKNTILVIGAGPAETLLPEMWELLSSTLKPVLKPVVEEMEGEEGLAMGAAEGLDLELVFVGPGVPVDLHATTTTAASAAAAASGGGASHGEGRVGGGGEGGDEGVCSLTLTYWRGSYESYVARGGGEGGGKGEGKGDGDGKAAGPQNTGGGDNGGVCLVVMYNPGVSCQDYDWSEALMAVGATQAPLLVTCSTQEELLAEVEIFEQAGFTLREFERVSLGSLVWLQSGSIANNLYRRNTYAFVCAPPPPPCPSKSSFKAAGAGAGAGAGEVVDCPCPNRANQHHRCTPFCVGQFGGTVGGGVGGERGGGKKTKKTKKKGGGGGGETNGREGGSRPRKRERTH